MDNDFGTPMEDGVAIRVVDAANNSKPVVVTMDQALAQAKDLMGSGKWMELVYDDNNSDVITNGFDFFADDAEARRRMAAANEVTFVSGLQGGDKEQA